MEVSSIKRESVADQIFGQLKAKIVSGELKPGDKLPTEMELCELYNVSRTSVRQALTNLSSLDLVEAKTGGGTFVKKADSSKIMDKLMLYTFLDERSLSEISEFRDILEPAVTRLACQRASADDIERLSEIYRQMEKQQSNLEEFAKLDFQFHTEIARISRNAYIIRTYEALEEILLNAFSEIVLKNGNRGGWRYHEQIIKAFKNRDAELAVSIMQEHMDRLLEDRGK